MLLLLRVLVGTRNPNPIDLVWFGGRRRSRRRRRRRRRRRPRARTYRLSPLLPVPSTYARVPENRSRPAAMAAALRHAARRIAGHARAVEVVQRRLFSAGRSSHAKEVLQGLTVDGEKNLLAGQVQKMKEDMYNVLADCQKKNMFHGDLAQHNGQLLELLSVQVEPRPNDFRWRSHRIGKKVRDCAMLAGVSSFTYVVLDVLTPNPKGRYKIETALEA